MSGEVSLFFGGMVVLGALVLAIIVALLCDVEEPQHDEDACGCHDDIPEPWEPQPFPVKPQQFMRFDSSACNWQRCLDCGAIGTQRSMVPDTSDPDRVGFLCAGCLRRRPPRHPSEMNL